MFRAIHAIVASLVVLAGAISIQETTVVEVKGEASLVRRASSTKRQLLDVSQPSNNETNDSEGDVGTAGKTALDRPDLTHSYIDEKVSGACNSHYKDFADITSNAECAKKCYETFGCTRFSHGGCSLGCRISVPGENTGTDTDSAPADGQCRTTAAGDHGKCMVYRLVFFHAVDQPGACDTHYERITDAVTKADCAHACKNTDGCKKFTSEPNCQAGCRISKCGRNHGGDANPCPVDSQCTLTTEQGCAVYELFR